MLKKRKQNHIKKKEQWHTFSNPFDAQASILKELPVHTIFDVGANAGQTSEAYRAHFPQATVYSFEPFPDSFAKLKKRHDQDTFVKPYQLALSNQTGIAPFHVNQCSANNSLLELSPEGLPWSPPDLFNPVSTMSVSTTTVDKFCSEQAISHIDILKMDAQGAELMILEGAAEMIQKGAIHLIFTEVAFVPLYAGQANFCELHAYLNKHGFQIFDFFHGRYAESGQLKWADVIFVKV